jgi:uncharacterized protein
MTARPTRIHVVDRRSFLVAGGSLLTGAVVSACASSRSGQSGAAPTAAPGSSTRPSTTKPPSATSTTASSAPATVAAMAFDRAARKQGLYVKMKDGTRIALDVWLPQRAGTERVPTLIQATRYQRAVKAESAKLEDDRNFAEASNWNDRGYALVLVDARGSGASFGTRSQELSEIEIDDYNDVLDWIGGQPWSNGRVGSYGVSYSGDTAELMARTKNKHLVAIAPQFSDFDAYRQTVFPGGAYFAGFDNWLALTQALDGIDGAAEKFAALIGWETANAATLIPQPAPVSAPDGPALVREAVAEHQKNTVTALENSPYRDDPKWETIAIATHRAAIEASGVPMFIPVGWYDAGTAAGALERFATFSNPIDMWIGPWNHGGTQAVDTVRSAAPVYPGVAPTDQTTEMAAFFDRYVRDGEKPVPGKRLRFATIGADGWTDTPTWPLRSVKDQTWYFAGDTLSSQPIAKPQVVAVPTTPHNTGATSRWMGQVTGGDIDYSTWNEGAPSRVAFTSPALDAPLRVCGFPVVSIDVSIEGDDGLIVAYLELVDPAGVAHYITEGVLRLSSRGRTSPKLRTDQRLDRSFAKDDYSPMPKGTPTSVMFEMMPTSVEFAAGSRMRVSFASSDKENLRVGKNSNGPISLGLNSDALIVLPVRA